MFSEIRPYYAEINIDNFRNNIKEIKKIAMGRSIIAVIKADAYGHGAVELSRVLEDEGIDYVAVAVLSEALELRRGGYSGSILILGYTPSNFVSELIKNDITQSVFSYELAEAISKEAQKQGKTAKIHIALDTGMSRIGFLYEEKSIEEIKRIALLKNIYLEGIFTHFSTADELDKTFSNIQHERFKKMVERLSNEGINFEIKHIANSAAIIDMPETLYNAVRPGIILYGYYPSNTVNKQRLNLKPIMTLKAKVVHVKEVPKNTPISYGRRYTTKKTTKIATLPFGYADGYSRAMAGKGKVIVNGKLAPVIGTICMDQCMVDVSECGDVNIGDEVVVMGEEDGLSNNADFIANALNTINYEVLCMVSKRVPRVYIEDNKIIKIKNYI